MEPNESYPHYIEFRHIYKTFDRPVLVDCNFQVDPGETVAIIGRSGVGKSVTLAHIMGFLRPSLVAAISNVNGVPVTGVNVKMPQNKLVGSPDVTVASLSVIVAVVSDVTVPVPEMK